MQTFVANNSRWRLAVFFLFSVGLVAAGLWMIGAFGGVPASPRYSASYILGLGWVCILLFSLGGLAIVKRFFDDRVQVEIGVSGIRWAPWSDQLIPWSEIRDVTTWSYKSQKSIVLHLNNPDRFPGQGIAAAFAGANRMLTGGDICITMAGTNRSYKAAMEAIAHFRGAKAPRL